MHLNVVGVVACSRIHLHHFFMQSGAGAYNLFGCVHSGARASLICQDVHQSAHNPTSILTYSPNWIWCLCSMHMNIIRFCMHFYNPHNFSCNSMHLNAFLPTCLYCLQSYAFECTWLGFVCTSVVCILYAVCMHICLYAFCMHYVCTSVVCTLYALCTHFVCTSHPNTLLTLSNSELWSAICSSGGNLQFELWHCVIYNHAQILFGLMFICMQLSPLECDLFGFLSFECTWMGFDRTYSHLSAHESVLYAPDSVLFGLHPMWMHLTRFCIHLNALEPIFLNPSMHFYALKRTLDTCCPDSLTPMSEFVSIWRICLETMFSSIWFSP